MFISRVIIQQFQSL